ncbi:MAG: TetR/AcrR family transcriptional regulator [Defluviitaleaceae bacterium]|nr:TetR/AcrR family transcriptional regulator [Defluviitaleaceae bacterium]MCL2835738.1 TetR/AcrR family transcriptional regulator [Defluviitaleaceae bacterium]
MNKKSDKKREFILAKAKQVFIRKGFAAVTMKDIIDECEISRGGIYLYFNSIDEIFMQVISAHNKQKLEDTQNRIQENKSFDQVLEDYLSKQKKRLLNIGGSLLMAMHEYRFSHKSDQDKEFYYEQFLNTKNIILELLRYGADKGEISCGDLEDMAMNIMFLIEGISTMALSKVVTEEIIDSQFGCVKKMIFSAKRI